MNEFVYKSWTSIIFSPMPTPYLINPMFKSCNFHLPYYYSSIAHCRLFSQSLVLISILTWMYDHRPKLKSLFKRSSDSKSRSSEGSSRSRSKESNAGSKEGNGSKGKSFFLIKRMSVCLFFCMSYCNNNLSGKLWVK